MKGLLKKRQYMMSQKEQSALMPLLISSSFPYLCRQLSLNLGDDM
jgi:hypothetical protein